MTTKQTTPYQLWDLSPVELPPRSRLYHLEPIGIGTAQVESLTSYLNRLARAHSVSARRLAMTEMRAVLESHYPAESVVTNTFGHINHTINGAGRSAIRAVLALEKLTLRNDLRFLTMWSWKVISAGSLLRSGRAWCPACYEQWRQAGQTLYEPLLWTLSVVTVCPQHHQRLVQQCPHQDCQATLPVLPPTGQSGYCSRCQGWLGVVSTEKEFVEPISSEQLWQANTVGELLVAAPSLPMPLPKERVAGIISKSVERGPTGSVYALSRMSGLPLDRLYAFLQETKALQLGLFLDTCYRLEISPLEYLIEPEMVENHCQIGAQEAASPYTLLEQDLSRFDFDQAQRVLTTLLANDEQPPSLREVARQLGQRENNLRRHFPELCQAIVEQRQQYQQAERLSLQPQLEAILANDKQLPLPLSEVAQRLECEPSFLQHRFPELCQAIAERHRTSQETEKLRLQRELETIVARNEIPPPFCSEVAQRLGQPTSTLQNRFPELCRIIIERHQHYHAAKRLRVRRELEAILANEDPPPSLSQVIARFDQTPPTFYHNYPELCQAIMERSQSYKAAEKLKTQGQLEAILASEEIPPPSLTEVAQRLEQSKNTLYSAFPELCQAIAEQGRQHWVREKLRMQHALAAALASEEAPPPSLAEMARQFACDRAVLQRNFPELCRMIVERRQQPQAAKKSKSQPQVAAILASEETPPPSLAEVARRLAYDKATFRRHFPEACQLIVERRQKYRAARKLRAQQALEAALVSLEQPPPSVVEMARQLEYDPVTLQRHFPLLCQALVERRRQYQEAEWLKTQDQLETILAKAEIPPPSLNEVAQRLGQSRHTLYTHFPELCQTLTERYQRYQQAEKFKLQDQLKAILTSDEQPPPSLAQVILRLRSNGPTLRCHFPELCQAIVERRQQYLKAEKLSIQQQLEAILASDAQPPPSLEKVAGELGASATTICHHYPELARNIAAKYSTYKKKSSRQKMEQLCIEVRQATFQVFQEGLYPSKYWVLLRLGKSSYLFVSPEIDTAWREALQELGLLE